MNKFERIFNISGLSLDRLRTFLMVVEAGNITKAAQGDSIRQSQFSRQIKELEGFFGVALTRRVGRLIEITEAGRQLALIIRRQFRELDDFRESMADRSVSIRIGSQGSVIDWLLLPRLGEIRSALGGVIVELEQSRTLDVVRAVSDGRLDFGIVREDSLPPETKHWQLGSVGYAIFAANSMWKGCASALELAAKAPVAELLAGGQFSGRWQEWLREKNLRPHVLTRVPSFTNLARLVQGGHAAAVLPEMAAVDFAPKQFRQERIAALKPRGLVLIANARSLDRTGVSSDATVQLSKALKLA